MAGATQITPLPRWRHDDVIAPGVGTLPVHPALAALLPGGLQRGTVVAVSQWGLLCLALAALAHGRGGAGQARVQWLWLPGPDGSVSIAPEAVVPGGRMRETG